jgi:RimJ/RimL family protein N-acetyltransferase
MKLLQTPRLIIRQFELRDAHYILAQTNQPPFIRYIANKNIKTEDAARQYLVNGPIASYDQFGFGLYAVELQSSGSVIGMCGLVKREQLAHPDLGFALLEQHFNQGYITEAADHILGFECRHHALSKILGVTLPDNIASNLVLEKLQFTRVGQIVLNGASNILY